MDSGTALTSSAWIGVCSRADLEDGSMYPYEVAGQRILICVVSDRVHATNNVCSHAFALLSDGWLDGCLVECPLHGAQFDVTTGAAVMGPADRPIEIYETRERDGRIEVLLPVGPDHG